MIVKKIMIYYLVYCLLLSVIGYLGDCLLNFNYAIKNPKYLPWYFILHLIFQVYIILPAIIGYVFLSEKIANHLVLKLIYMLLVSLGMALFLYADDYSLTIGRYSKVKQVVVYLVSGLILFGWAERAKLKMHGSERLF